MASLCHDIGIGLGDQQTTPGFGPRLSLFVSFHQLLPHAVKASCGKADEQAGLLMQAMTDSAFGLAAGIQEMSSREE